MRRMNAKWKRALAILLTATMLLQNSIVISAGEASTESGIMTVSNPDEDEQARLQSEQESNAESERLRSEAESNAESERLRSESESNAESERLRSESESNAESERLQSEAESNAESERLQSEAESNKQSEKESNAESERLRNEAESNAQSENARKQSEAESSAKAENEAESRRQSEAESQAAADAAANAQNNAEQPTPNETQPSTENETAGETETEGLTEGEEETEEITYRIEFGEKADEHGTIRVKDEEGIEQDIEIKDYYKEVEKDGTFVFKVVPDEGYKVDHVKVEDKEVPKTESEEKNEYKVEHIIKNIEINVSYLEITDETELESETNEQEFTVDLHQPILKVGDEAYLNGYEGSDHSWLALKDGPVEILGDSTGALGHIRAVSEGTATVSHAYKADDVIYEESFVVTVTAAADETESTETETEPLTEGEADLSGMEQMTELESESESETESELESIVTFAIDEGATVTVDGEDVTADTVVAVQDGTLAFTVAADEGYTVTEVLAGDTPIEKTETEETEAADDTETDAAKTPDAYLLEGIDAAETVVTVHTEILEAKTEFVYEDDTVKITAIVPEEAMLSEDVELAADYMDTGNADYQEAVSIVEEESNNNNDEIRMVEYVGFNVYFTLDGDKVNPEATSIDFNVEYKDDAFTDTDIPMESYTTYQLDNNLAIAEEVDESKIAAAEFTAQVNDNSNGEYGIMTIAKSQVVVKPVGEVSYGVLGSKKTQKYQIVYNGKTYNAMCIRPGDEGPGSNWNIKLNVDNINNKWVSRLTYYAYHPQALIDNGFFDTAATAYNKAEYKTADAIFVLCHITAGKIYGDNAKSGKTWDSGVNAAGKELAGLLETWIEAEYDAEIVTSGSERISYSNGKWIQTSKHFKLSSHGCLPYFYMDIPADITFHQGSTSISGKKNVKVNANEDFWFTASVDNEPPSVINVSIKSSDIPNGSKTLVVYGSSVAGEYTTGGTYWMQDFAASTSTTTNETATFSVKWTTREINVTKVDENNAKLGGVTLGISKNSEAKTAEDCFTTWITTKENPKNFGLNDFDGQGGSGTYYLVEVSAPKGYGIAPSIPFTIDAQGNFSVNNITMINTLKLQKIEFYKYEETDNNGTPAYSTPLSGITFGVYKDYKNGAGVGDALDTIITDGNGHGVSNVELPFGTYWLVEQTPPANHYKVAVQFTINESTYKEDGTPYTVQTDDGKLIDYLYRATLRIVKQDATTGKNIPLGGDNGATFEVRNSAGEVATVTTNENGTADIPNLPAGTYTIKETKAPDGYQLNKTEFTVTIEMDNSNAEKPAEVPVVEYVVEDTEIKGSLNIEKLVEQAVSVSGEPGAITFNYEYVFGDGIEFGLYESAEAETPAYTFTTGSDGTGNISDLKLGVYWLKEMDPPKGHIAMKPVEIDLSPKSNSDGQKTEKDYTSTLTGDAAIRNDYQTAELVMIKTDGETTEPVAGAEFGLYAGENITDGSGNVLVEKDTLISKAVSGSDGKIVFEQKLPVGLYYAKEEKAPAGYQLSTEHTIFDVNGEQTEKSTAVYEATGSYINNATKVAFAKVKADSLNRTYLEGAHLQVLDSSGNVATTIYGDTLDWKSGIDAKIVKGLPAGEYKLHEAEAPSGYLLADDIPFSIGEDGTVTGGVETTTNDGTIVLIEMEDAYTELQVAKVMEDGYELKDGEEIVFELSGKNEEIGAPYTIILNKANRQEDGSYLSAVIKGLPAGTYTLTETKAPAGFKLANPVDVEIKADGEKQTIVVEVENKATEFTFSKKSLTGADELEGAHLQILEANEDGSLKKDENGNPIVAKTVYNEELDWTSSTTAKTVKGMKPGHYVMHEEGAPAGYAFTNDIPFTVADEIHADDEAGSLEMTDNALHLHVNKVDVTGAAEVEGAELTLYKKDGDSLTEVETWVSKAGETHDFGSKLEAGGEYLLREDLAPTGWAYTTDIDISVAKDGTITTAAQTTTDADGNTVYLVQDTALHFFVNKVDVANSQELDGAVITVYKKNADGSQTEVASWTSRIGEAHDFGSVLEAGGSYVLVEEAAPNGYKFTNNIDFNVGRDGTITTTANTATDAAGNTVYLVQDEATVGEFSKVDENGQPLAGAVLQIVDAAGNVVEQWTTDGTPHTVTSKLAVGQSYTLVEVTAPQYYQIAEPIPFTVGMDGSIPPVVMQDARQTVNEEAGIAVTKTLTFAGEPVSAVDQTFYVALYADEARTQRVSDVQAIEFHDGSSSTVVFTGVELGRTYYIGECDASGVLIEAGATADGTVYTANFNEGYSAVVENPDQTVTVYFENEFWELPEGFYKEGSLAVTKSLSLNGEPMGAVDQTFYVALYEDEARTQRISDVMPLEFRNGSSATVEFTGLDLGRTYYVGECDANGVLIEAGATLDGTVYTANFSQGYSAVIENPDESQTIYFENEFMELPEEGYYREGELNITKKLIGKDGNAKNAQETFYAGIFADAGFTTLSDQVSENIIELPLNGNSSVTKNVKVGLPADGGSTTLYVTEVDQNGTPVEGSPSFRYNVTVDNQTVTMSESSPEQNVVITNYEGELQKSVKTGDETPIVPFAIAFIAAAAVILFLVFRRRRKNSVQ